MKAAVSYYCFAKLRNAYYPFPDGYLLRKFTSRLSQAVSKITVQTFSQAATHENGTRGDKGQEGINGLPGLKGKPGTACDCGRYRKVVGQMDINISKLKNAVKFLKNVVLGIRETENMFYLLVTEARRYQESLLNCKLRGGSLAMPRTTETNTLLADYIREADLTHVFIGLQVGVTEVGYTYVDGNLFLNTTVWSLQSPHSGKGDCVQLGSTGAWSQVDCGATQYYICEFVKNKNTSATSVL
uniref:Collectin-10-like n=1 Tax=Sinocyclocheilus grahami TaxID=75366 RepID=A0A672M7S9_SINGR